MLKKKKIYCGERKALVDALVDEKILKNGTVEVTVMSCMDTAVCARTTFCRFVNPLTVRNPLDPAAKEAAQAG